ncbi:MAG TPA: class I SAM-dependent methyltransferase [Hungateiclostridium thermocellum]|uniref:Methyltransferase small n=1 Tax=Acetivibrio thermocellus (strain ATCC 27405 / DSM 1237 / JCM 9322 / NBRC 103400 / NCIMB 10682 / NRRL B-4536 / VPI 7372) TaxID=203119 RepID=A3DJK4_ACET2|nr:class I SAM-dependent methyltransferase [Acetivibrio thermocellus]CDG37426.1 methyltransferase small [Acetivibrio thermocellus BC1]ABN54133.1 methyltransferase small [Acetivibrio thermocellus ATCC 27405]NLU26003.1 class I SAM-dependent methyltransferase [Acetivibrio thermocellus]THJ77427.1 class I SAM-dependent methyltransferase [Acetivibrio thermocellus]UWV47398.1 class I SAM-dependent methyltransferase [Acetivibrio thermocellus]
MNHYYTQNPDTPHDVSTISYTVKDRVIKFNTDAGVFSKRRVDFGSDLLIRSVPPLDGSILDIGCGYGVIGISLALLNPSSFVTMIDINERAVDLASQNIHLNGVTNATALTSDGFSNVSDKFDAIVSNPPIRAGKKVIYPIFADSINHLNPGGSIYLVIQKKQGANSAIEFLKSVYGNCEVINKKAGYWIMKSTKE